MTFDHAQLIEVRLHGQTAGAVAPSVNGTQFQFDPSWLRTGVRAAR
ncbi:hypothetical protein SAMN06309944_1462 [Micrococcales bacterium KH10]|nr:hypothetical protein SAMN06309944_1462 [Micrococcales bacterium KH10]